MRKKFTLKLLVVLLLSWIGLSAKAQSVTYEGLNYEIDLESMTATCVGPVDENLEVAKIVAAVEYEGQDYPVISIGDGVFAGCSSLTSVSISDSVTSIGNYAFGNCASLIEINVNENNAFYASLNGILYNKDLSILIQCPGAKTSVIIPDSVTSIGNRAFYFCKSLTELIIPDSVISIGDHAFYCSSLKSVTFGNSVKSIGNYAFWCCRLTELTIPDSVTSIGDYAFYACYDLIKVKIGNGLTSTGVHTFGECKSLTSVIIPDSVTSIGDYSFETCGALTEVIIPNSVTYIGADAFFYCTSLTSVTIGNSVTEIGNYAFVNCISMTDVTCLAFEPPTCGDDLFYGVTISECVLKVPESSVQLYKTTYPWNEFIVEGIETPEDPIYVGGASAMKVIEGDGVSAIKINWNGETLSLNEKVDGLLTVESSNGNNPFISDTTIEDNIYLVIKFAEPFNDEAILTINIPRGYVTVGKEGVYNEFEQLILSPASVVSFCSDQEIEKVYNLQGVKMNATDASQLPAGMYIINGRKVVVK